MKLLFVFVFTFLNILDFGVLAPTEKEPDVLGWNITITVTKIDFDQNPYLSVTCGEDSPGPDDCRCFAELTVEKELNVDDDLSFDLNGGTSEEARIYGVENVYLCASANEKSFGGTMVKAIRYFLGLEQDECPLQPGPRNPSCAKTLVIDEGYFPWRMQCEGFYFHMYFGSSDTPVFELDGVLTCGGH